MAIKPTGDLVRRTEVWRPRDVYNTFPPTTQPRMHTTARSCFAVRTKGDRAMSGLATMCTLCGVAFEADHARIVAGRWWLCEACYAIANRDDDQPTTDSRDGEKGCSGPEA